MTPEQAFGQVLGELRRARGLSQEQLGFDAGFSRVYIGELERGQKSPSLRALFRIAPPLRVPASELVRLAERRLADAASD